MQKYGQSGSNFGANQQKSTLNGNLPIEIKFNKTGTAKIHVPKKGPGGNALSKKSAEIAQYIADHIDFNYIPAIRTEEEALDVVKEMLSEELALLEQDPQFIKCLDTIQRLQQPILDRLGNSIKASLHQFLPNIKAVEVAVPSAARRHALRNQCEIYVDDGSRTLLDYKGDGVKSLAALGLLKDSSKKSAASIIAIEEPESHLHPGAIHGLRDVIQELTKTNQVVITTHCPLFADREFISRNVIVDSNSAKPAKDINSIRKILGIRASDNLVNASHVLVVEGDEDVIALTSLLSHSHGDISKALRQYQLVIEPIGGAGNLSYRLTQLHNALCVIHVVLDNDQAGRDAYEAAAAEGLIDQADVTFTNRRGARESEMEDLFDPSSYAANVLQEFGVDINVPDFRGNAKWSERMGACFVAQGKLWRNREQVQVKAVVAEAVASNPANALSAHHRSSFDALLRSLLQKLKIQPIDE